MAGNCDAYVICTSPRSGSTLLCNLLSATGVAGCPNSHFHEPSLQAWLDDYGLTEDTASDQRAALQSVFRVALVRGRGATDVFGLRLQRHSFPFFVEKLADLHPSAPTQRERIEAAFGKTQFIHLKRQDKVEQAVSYVKAEQTGLWHVAPDGTEIERLAPAAEPRYDHDVIRDAYEMFLGFDAEWEDWFESEDIRPIRIVYESFVKEPITSTKDVLNALGLDPSNANGVEIGVAKLADHINDDWSARFRADQALART